MNRLKAMAVVIIFSVIFLLLFISCGSEEAQPREAELTREVILEKFSSEDIRSLLTEKDMEATVKKEHNGIKSSYDTDISLLQSHVKRKCIGAHTLYIISEISGEDFSQQFRGEAVVINDYVITTEKAVPDLEEFEQSYKARFELPALPPMLPPGMSEDKWEQERRKAEERAKEAREKDYNFEIIIILSLNFDETKKIEVLSEVFRDNDTGIVLLRRARGEFEKYRKYAVPEDCPLKIADSESIKTDVEYKNYVLGIAGYNADFVKGKQVVSIEAGYLLHFNRENHELRFIGSVLPNELGGAVYIPYGGDPHLLGIVTATGAIPFGFETEAIAIDINYLINLFRKNGFELFPEGDEEEASESP